MCVLASCVDSGYKNTFPNGQKMPSIRRHVYIGTILKWRPTSHLEIKWDRSNKGSAAGSRLSFQLARDGDETRLSLIHGGADVFDDEEQRAVLDKEWRQALASLQSNLDAP
jgi:uncharacterized protein YndB with AHSA1/START domain